jgi:hypothetical protein
VKKYKVMLILMPLVLLVATLTTIFARGDIATADKLTAEDEVRTLSNEPEKIINTGIVNDSQADNALDRTGSENAEPGETEQTDDKGEKASDDEVEPSGTEEAIADAGETAPDAALTATDKEAQSNQTEEAVADAGVTAPDANAQKATDNEAQPNQTEEAVADAGETAPDANAQKATDKGATPTPLPDDDGDGILNIFEEAADLDPFNPDTDGDGLDDLYEIMSAKTDPRETDGDENGVLDGDEDPDEDGLTNIREYMLGTDPQKNDSDRDGLSDYDEAETYGSDPLVEDTDGDGLTDLDESILGLDPNESKTNGSVLDSERTFDQVLSEASYDEGVLKAEDPLIPSISANVRGVIDRHIRVWEGTDIYNDNRAVIAKPIDIWSNLDDAKIILKYECSDEIEDADEFLKGLSIFEKTLEEGLVPLESVVEGRTISVEVNAEGVYMVIDVDNFLMGFGIDVLGNLK